MPRRLGLRDAIDAVSTAPVGFLREAFDGEPLAAAPYTTRIILAIAALFVVEVILRVHYGAASTQQLVTALFVVVPEIAWPLAPWLHRGIGHLAANVAVLYVAMPVEARLERLEYFGLIVAAGYLPVYLDGMKLALLGAEPHVAAYGTSAFAYGLVGVGAAALLADESEPTPREWLMLVLAFAAIAAVVVDIVTAIPDPINMNLGHLGGVLIGLGLGYVIALRDYR